MFLASDVCLIQSPCWVLTIAKCFIELVFFILQQLFVGTDCPGPVFKDADNTIFGKQVVVTVPLQIQICVWAFCILMLKGCCKAVA